MITFIESFKKELESEAVGTRKMLALVPSDKLAWKPHPRSMKMQDLAIHIADLPTWISLGLTTDELDFATSPYNPKDCTTGDELVAYFNKNVEKAMKDFDNANEKILEEFWTLRNGSVIYVRHTKLETIRHAFCQMVHHRAQLGVYLRLLDIPIPGVYGPSADDQQMM
ncbi:MAG: DinB family protein [Bacteroidetes bacterium]|nr:DinB family protein [Bacteroidota bacterium]MBK7429383.1 DinB family protein [Bacteroidota bacterium]MBK7572561.1 DinB family protein [Bacteroidota bacterium]